MLPVYVEIFRCNKKHSVTLCFLGETKRGRGKEGVRVAKVPLELNALLLYVGFCLIGVFFVTWSVSHLSLQALTMLLCFANVCGVFSFLLAFLWAVVSIQMRSEVMQSDFELISPCNIQAFISSAAERI